MIKFLDFEDDISKVEKQIFDLAHGNHLKSNFKPD